MPGKCMSRWQFCISPFGIYLSHNVRKRNFWYMRPIKTQIGMRIRAFWLEFLFATWWNCASLAIQNAPSEDSGQTGRMRSLIRIFTGRTCPNVRILTYILFIICDMRTHACVSEYQTGESRNQTNCRTVRTVVVPSPGLHKETWSMPALSDRTHRNNPKYFDRKPERTVYTHIDWSYAHICKQAMVRNNCFFVCFFFFLLLLLFLRRNIR